MGLGESASAAVLGIRQMVILVCGLSKCGKSSLIASAISLGMELRAVKASQLLRSSGRPTQALTASEALDNQPELKRLLSEYGRDGQPIILDGHLLIETVDGPQLVPESLLATIGLIGVIAVKATPELVSERRRGTAFTTNQDEIRDLALIEITQAARYTRIAGMPFIQVDNDDPPAFIKAVARCLTTTGAKSH